MEAPIYNKEGKPAGKIQLPEAVFGQRFNADLVHQVVVSLQANARHGTAHAKDRSEVRGGGKKPWRQKGTGRARHGSIRSPIWKGGGATHGPRTEKKYAKKINRRMKAAALASVLSQKWSDGEIVFLESLGFTKPKTRDARALLSALASVKDFSRLATKRRNAALVLLPEKDIAAEKSFRNMGNVAVAEARNVTPVDLLTRTYVVCAEPEKLLTVLQKRVGESKKSVTAKKARGKESPKAETKTPARTKTKTPRPRSVAR